MTDLGRTAEDPQPMSRTDDSDASAAQAAQLAEVPLCGSFALVVDELRDKRVCDLGCNDGHYLQFAGPGSLGLDVSQESLRLCHKRGLQATHHDLNQLPLPVSDAAFEVVLLSHVLEHVHAPLAMLRECNRILRPSGKLIVGLPIEDGVYSRLRMDYFGGGEGHLYSFSLRNLNKLLGLTGFVCERTVCHLPRLGNRTSVWNERLHRLFGTRLYSLSAAYWCVARKISSPVADQQLSDYFER